MSILPGNVTNGREAMEEERELFAPGDMVVWREPDTEFGKRVMEGLRKDFGEGPFRVDSVRNVTDEALQYHPQVVNIRTATGAILPLSGRLLTHA